MFRVLALSFLLVMLTGPTTAAEDPVYTGLLSNTGAGGYDVVSYFDTEQAVKAHPATLPSTWVSPGDLPVPRTGPSSRPTRKPTHPCTVGIAPGQSARATLPRVIPSIGPFGMASCT